MSRFDNPIFRVFEYRSVLQLKVALDKWPTYLLVPDQTGRTILSHACGKGWTEIVEVLLQRSTEWILTPDQNGSLPIHFAAQRGRTEVIAKLISQGSPAQLRTENIWGRTPLWYGLHLPTDYDKSVEEKIKVVSLLVQADPSLLTSYTSKFSPIGEELPDPKESFLWMMYKDPIYSQTVVNSMVYPQSFGGLASIPRIGTSRPVEGSTAILSFGIKAVGLNWILPSDIPAWIEMAIQRMDGITLQQLLEIGVKSGIDYSAIPGWIQTAIEISSLEILKILGSMLPMVPGDLTPDISKWASTLVSSNRLDELRIILPPNFEFPADQKSLLKLVPIDSTEMFSWLVATQTWSQFELAKALLKSLSFDGTAISRLIYLVGLEIDTGGARIWLNRIDSLLQSEAISIELRNQLRRELTVKTGLLKLISTPRSAAEYRRRFVNRMEVMVRYGGANALWNAVQREGKWLIQTAIRHRQFDQVLFLVWLGCELKNKQIGKQLAFVWKHSSKWDPGYTGSEVATAVSLDDSDLGPSDWSKIRSIKYQVKPDAIGSNRLMILRTLGSGDVSSRYGSYGSLHDCMYQEISTSHRLLIREAVYFSRSLVERLLYFI